MSISKFLHPKIVDLIKYNLTASKEDYVNSKKFYREFLKPNDLCFDIGANLGNRTKVFKSLGCKVVSVEPQNHCFIYLKKVYGNSVHLENLALGDKEGAGEIYICETSDVISTMSDKWKNEGRFSNNYSWNKKQSVKIQTLDNLIKKYGIPDFCKIDVEGYEYNVIKGLTAKIPLLSFEFTKEFIDETFKCINYLKELGDLSFNYSLAETYKFELDKWINESKFIERMNLLKNDDWGDIYIKFK